MIRTLLKAFVLPRLIAYAVGRVMGSGKQSTATRRR